MNDNPRENLMKMGPFCNKTPGKAGMMWCLKIPGIPGCSVISVVISVKCAVDDPWALRSSTPISWCTSIDRKVVPGEKSFTVVFFVVESQLRRCPKSCYPQIKIRLILKHIETKAKLDESWCETKSLSQKITVRP